MASTEQRLADIERTNERVLAILENLQKDLKTELSNNGEFRDKIYLMIYGDGNGNRGLLVRIDRLEQSNERQKWLIRSLTAGIIAMAARMIVALI